jgi:hypothetical protein
MRTAPRPQTEAATPAESATVISFELSRERWVLTIRPPVSNKPSRSSVPAG